MSGVNLVIIAGRLGKDPELRYTKDEEGKTKVEVTE